MYYIVLVTCPGESAEKVADAVLESRAAACVTSVGPVNSRYYWKGKLESADEMLLLFKTRGALFERLERAVREVHPYETPEIIAVRVGKGSAEYLKWIGEVTRGGGPRPRAPAARSR